MTSTNSSLNLNPLRGVEQLMTEYERGKRVNEAGSSTPDAL